MAGAAIDASKLARSSCWGDFRFHLDDPREALTVSRRA